MRYYYSSNYLDGDTSHNNYEDLNGKTPLVTICQNLVFNANSYPQQNNNFDNDL